MRLKTEVRSRRRSNATGVVAITPIKYASDDPENTTVTLTDAKGAEVEGTQDKDGKTTPTRAKSTRVFVKKGDKWMLVHANFGTDPLPK